MTTGRAMPATTWALVTTMPGATTNPEPSWMSRTPPPPPARSTGRWPGTAARTAALPGRATGAAVSGGSPENTTGNPSEARKVSTWANTVGTESPHAQM